MYMPGVLFGGKCINCLTNVCIMHFTECPDLKPLSGCGHSTRRKAEHSSPEHQESSNDTEASGRAGSKKLLCIHVYSKIHTWCSLFGKSA